MQWATEVLRPRTRGLYERINEEPSQTHAGPDGKTGAFWAQSFVNIHQYGVTSVCFRADTPKGVRDKAFEYQIRIMAEHR